MKRVVFHPEAKAELSAAARWYNAEVRGLGNDLRKESEAAVARIVASPEAFGLVADEVRCHLMHRFPYGILYQVRPDQIFIVAIMHLHRDPDYWRDRL